MTTKLTILLLTYERTNYALKTLESLHRNLIGSMAYHWHIADDGSRPEHRQHLEAYMKAASLGYSISNSEGSGYGGNYNLATQSIHPHAALNDLVLPVEDDWVLTRPLDVAAIGEALEELGGGCVRLGYIGFTQELKATFVEVKSMGRLWLRLDPDSPERHVFAGHPRIETVEWERQAGEWIPGLEPGATEFEVAGRLWARDRVYWPMEDNIFAHIGTIRSTDSEALIEAGVLP